MASPLLAGLTILMLGDSHFATSGYLVTTLQDALVQQGAQVTTEAACGAATGVWVEAGVAPCGTAERKGLGPVTRDDTPNAAVPSLSALIAGMHPNLIVIGAGDTMAGYAQPQFTTGWLDQQVGELTDALHATGIACVWIGPGWGTEGGPYFKTYARVRQVNDYLSQHVSPCRYIDSTRFSAPGEWGTFDGQHYTRSGYQKWGAAIDNAIVGLAEGHTQAN